ncbi:MAG: phenylacetate--CoA ligase family protein [Chloroflexota bacterium]|nr:MAG: phenylacetate--CoA ligase family protein [Chloroflexota bacterium]
METQKPLPPFEKMEKMSSEERRKLLDEQLKWLVAYAYEKAPSTRARFDEAGISPSKVSGIKDLENLPLLRKDALVDLYKANPPLGGLVTVPISELERVYVSPGPIYDPHHSSETYWQRHVHLVKSVGFRKGDIVVNSWMYNLVPAGLMIDEALRRAGVTVIPTGVGNTELQVQVMHQLRATGFAGTTGFFMNIIDKAKEMGLDVSKDFNLRMAVIGGEMGGGPIRKKVEEEYGIDTGDMYGTADVGLIAFECSAKSGMHIAEGVIFEMISYETGKPVEPGEVGEIVVTPIDEIYPLIRFGTGDIASWINEPCPCGRTSPRITRLLGRVGDAVRTRGMFIHPRQLEPAMAKFSQIAQYQAVVTRPGTRDDLALKVELKTEEGVDKEKLASELIQVVSEALRIKVDRVEFVAKGVIPEWHKLIVDERVY